MSERRQARARVSPLVSSTESGEVPKVLAVGRLVEVWAEEGVNPPTWSARKRFNQVRRVWGEAAGLKELELQAVAPFGSPWSADFVGDEYATERLGRAGCTLADLPALRDQAERLHREATHA